VNNDFKRPKFVDHVLVKAGTDERVGTIRVKPSGVSWKPKSGKRWLTIKIPRFEELAMEHGKKKQR